jgi:LuxR family maltose regulon positive regulatory protein
MPTPPPRLNAGLDIAARIASLRLAVDQINLDVIRCDRGPAMLARIRVAPGSREGSIMFLRAVPDRPRWTGAGDLQVTKAHRLGPECSMSTPAYTPLIKTKITIPPLRPNLVVRQRLLELMGTAVQKPLTLVSAPAGFGKTTLITGWLYETGQKSRVAWLSLDPYDSDPVHFMYHLLASLQNVEPRVGRAPVSLLGSVTMPGPKDLMALLLNEIAAAEERIVLVLDDYHAIDNGDIDAALELLVERMPETLRLVVATREEPKLPLPRWRALERMVEIGPEDLRFSYEEAVMFFRQTMGLDIDPKLARALEDRTEGWITGLQLAALSLRLRGQAEPMNETAKTVARFGGTSRHVVDYLAAEVLRRQPDDIRAFLHRTSILDRLCASLCDALTGRSDSEAVLAQLEQTRMFLLPLDDHREWYRYHQLFAEFLRGAVPAAEQRELHQKASAWYEAHSLGAEAIKHALAAKDTEACVRLIRARVQDTLARGEMPTVLAWLDQLPESALRAHGDLAGYKAWLLSVRGQTATGETYAALSRVGDGEDAQPGHLGMVLAFRAFVALNWSHPKEAVPLARQALHELGDHASFFHGYALCLLGQAQYLSDDRRAAVATLHRTVDAARALGNHLMTLDAVGHLAVMLRAQGQLREAIAMCQDAAERYRNGGDPPPIVGLVYAPLGMLYYELDDLAAARRLLTTGIELCRQLGMAYFRLLGKCALAKLQHISGEFDQAWTTLAVARDVSDRPESPRRQRMVAAMMAELQLREGNVDAAARTLEDARNLPGSTSEQEALLQARLLLAQRNPSMAWKQLIALEEIATREESRGSLVAINVLQALCKRALGQHSGAQDRLEAAISFAASGGYRRIFLDEGANLTAMLTQARHVAPAFVSSLLEQAAPEQPARPAAPLPEPLSKVEVEILGLLNGGLTNQEIADELRMTVGTTKWRMNQIFGKLQVRNRVEALTRARQLRLL